MLQHRFHVELLLILDTKFGTHLSTWITWQIFVSLACCHRRTAIKEETRAHATTGRTPSSPPSPLCRDPFTAATAPMLGPLRRNCHDPFIDAAEGAPPRSKDHRRGSTLTSPHRAASSPPHGRVPAPAWTSPLLQLAPVTLASSLHRWPSPQFFFRTTEWASLEVCWFLLICVTVWP
jgi:hypothetical protein